MPPKEEQSVSEDWLIEGERKEETKQGTTEKEWTFLSLNIVRVSYVVFDYKLSQSEWSFHSLCWVTWFLAFKLQMWWLRFV